MMRDSDDMWNMLCPMHLRLDNAGVIVHVGPTLAKLQAGSPFCGQDIQEVFPDAVQTYKALFNEDDTEETELLLFNPSELTFTLINAVKELKAEIELLKQQINN